MIKIKYNNAVIADLESDGGTILKCNGKLMEDDVTVKVNIPKFDGTIEIGSAEI